MLADYAFRILRVKQILISAGVSQATDLGRNIMKESGQLLILQGGELFS